MAVGDTTVGSRPFLEGYASIRSIPDYQELMPFLRLGKAIATIGFTVKQGTWASKHARIYHFSRQFLETFDDYAYQKEHLFFIISNKSIVFLQKSLSADVSGNQSFYALS